MNEIPTNNPEFFPDGLMKNVVTEATTSIECVNNNKRNGKIKVPDKIYIPIYLNDNLDGELLGDEWMYEPHKEVNNAEYISKDYLLEWAKEHYTDLDITKRDLWDCGYNCAMKQLIEKLESL